MRRHEVSKIVTISLRDMKFHLAERDVYGETASADGKGHGVRREFNILALIKGEERYVFVYDDDSRASLIDIFRDTAADPQLSFSWFDATVLTQKAREQAAAVALELPPSRTGI